MTPEQTVAVLTAITALVAAVAVLMRELRKGFDAVNERIDELQIATISAMATALESTGHVVDQATAYRAAPQRRHGWIGHSDP